MLTHRTVEIYLIDPPIADTDELNRAITDPAHPMHRQAAMWHRRCFSPVYEPELNYRAVITYERSGDTHAVLNHAFETLNIGGCEIARRYRADGNRSLSVGDLVVVDGEAWLCARFGWEPVPEWHRPATRRPEAGRPVIDQLDVDGRSSGLVT